MKSLMLKMFLAACLIRLALGLMADKVNERIACDTQRKKSKMPVYAASATNLKEAVGAHEEDVLGERAGVRQ